jgi:hypothetical protein
MIAIVDDNQLDLFSTVAMSAADRLGAAFPPDSLLDLLGHDDPAVRADACRCARPTARCWRGLSNCWTTTLALVRIAAACALGRVGRAEALAEIADEDAIILLGRKARASPDLAQPIIEALDGRDDPLGLKVAEGLWRERARGGS